MRFNLLIALALLFASCLQNSEATKSATTIDTEAERQLSISWYTSLNWPSKKGAIVTCDPLQLSA